jgi:hypothetical protein
MEHVIAWDRTTKDRPTQVIWDLEAKLVKDGPRDELRTEIIDAGGQLINATIERALVLYFRIEGELMTHRPRSIAEAIEIYVGARDASGLGASDFGDADIEVEDGDEWLYRISYNGRLWIPRPRTGQ